MRALRFALPILLLGLVSLVRASAEEMVSLSDAVGIEEIVSATVIHSPKGFASTDGRATAYVNDRESLDSLLKVLSDVPSRGGSYKSWPGDIPHWRVYVHGKDRKAVALDVYGYSLQSPIDATFSPSKSDPKNGELMKLLQKMLKAKEKG